MMLPHRDHSVNRSPFRLNRFSSQLVFAYGRAAEMNGFRRSGGGTRRGVGSACLVGQVAPRLLGRTGVSWVASIAALRSRWSDFSTVLLTLLLQCGVVGVSVRVRSSVVRVHTGFSAGCQVSRTPSRPGEDCCLSLGGKGPGAVRADLAHATAVATGPVRVWSSEPGSWAPRTVTAGGVSGVPVGRSSATAAVQTPDGAQRGARGTCPASTPGPTTRRAFRASRLPSPAPGSRTRCRSTAASTAASCRQPPARRRRPPCRPDRSRRP